MMGGRGPLKIETPTATRHRAGHRRLYTCIAARTKKNKKNFLSSSSSPPFLFYLPTYSRSSPVLLLNNAPTYTRTFWKFGPIIEYATRRAGQTAYTPPNP